MPTLSFDVRWPDGSLERCSSPSTVVAEHFDAGAGYAVEEFVARSRAALGEASARVAARYGFACTQAAAQLEAIEEQAGRFPGDAVVVVEAFGR